MVQSAGLSQRHPLASINAVCLPTLSFNDSYRIGPPREHHHPQKGSDMRAEVGRHPAVHRHPVLNQRLQNSEAGQSFKPKPKSYPMRPTLKDVKFRRHAGSLQSIVVRSCIQRVHLLIFGGREDKTRGCELGNATIYGYLIHHRRRRMLADQRFQIRRPWNGRVHTQTSIRKNRKVRTIAYPLVRIRRLRVSGIIH